MNHFTVDLRRTGTVLIGCFHIIHCQALNLYQNKELFSQYRLFSTSVEKLSQVGPIRFQNDCICSISVVGTTDF